MRIKEILSEGRAHPVIVVDVQPEYSGVNDGDENPVFEEIIQFVNQQTGPVLMFVNAEDQGMSGDTVAGIKQYWEDTVSPINWNRFTIVDKGYGYLRSWMDEGYADRTIVQVIREMYRQKVSSSSDLFGGEHTAEYSENMKNIMGHDFNELSLSDPIAVNWTSIAQLKRFNGAYIVGGGRNECLREVELLMNAFNIRYRRIDHLVY